MRLRQIVIVAADLAAVESEIEQRLGLELCYRDPGVGHFGLRNGLFPIGDKLLEVVSPITDGSAAGRFLDKRGDGGYMIMLEVEDLTSLRERLVDLGVRVVFETRADGIIDVHLHPGDIGGAILAVDRTDTWGEWPWAGPNWRDHVRTELVNDALAVVIEAEQPAEVAARWAAVLGRDATDDVITLDEGEIRFVAAGERGEGVAGFVLRASSPEHVTETSIGGCSFQLVCPP